MVDFIIKKFIKDCDNVNDSHVREAYGKLGSIVGIIANMLISLSKISIGVIFKSISITADGVNNLSDAGSSVITLIGFKLSSKPADKGHPFGHARIEYVTGLIVGFIILMLGFELIRTSYDKIVYGEESSFSVVMIVILVISIAIKLWLSYFNGYLADKIASATMKATSVDSRNDVIATSAVLVSVIISKITGFQVDGYMGIAVALFIIYSGFQILKDILNPLLGEMPDEEFIYKIQEKIRNYDGILNIHDLVVHNYGPNKYFATVHAEVDAKQDIMKSHDLIDNIERDFAKDLDINLVIHLDPVIIDDKEINNLKIMTENIIREIDERLSIHDFRIVKGDTHTNIIFDVLVPVDYNISAQKLVSMIEKSVKKVDKTYYTVITVDKNYVTTYTNKPYMK